VVTVRLYEGSYRKANALKIDTVSQVSAASADWATLARNLIGGHINLLPQDSHHSLT